MLAVAAEVYSFKNKETVMQFKITGKGIDVTDAIKAHAEEKTAKLPRYYSSISSVEVILDNDAGSKPSVEIIARGEHNKVFVVTEQGNGDADLYACIDVAVHKMERQISKAKDKERNPMHN